MSPAAVAETVRGWWFTPLPKGRIAWLRTLLYSFIFIDVFVTTAWVADHAGVPGDLYQPLFFGRILPMPTPTSGLITGVQIALLIAAAVGATNRFPRAAGIAVAVLYTEWMFIAMSYGKVDHDRFGFLVALAVLPTVGAARWGDKERTEAAGWAIRCIQVAVVATYFLAAFAKLRFGGPEWVNGATLMRAVLRRGTFIGDELVNYPWILHMTQWLIMVFELSSPLLLAPGKLGRFFLFFAVGFHLVTYAMITIIFLPHIMCLLSFAPLEKLGSFWMRRRARAPASAPGGV